jgi:hypothetical protein
MGFGGFMYLLKPMLAAKILFANMGFGGFMYLLGAINVFSANNTFPVNISALGKKLLLRTGTNPNVTTTITGGTSLFTGPDVSPAGRPYESPKPRPIPGMAAPDLPPSRAAKALQRECPAFLQST